MAPLIRMRAERSSFAPRELNESGYGGEAAGYTDYPVHDELRRV
jgi:hypothetical protein